MIVSLQDVVVFLGLSIDDPPVTRTDNRDWVVESERLLGSETPSTSIKTGAWKLK